MLALRTSPAGFPMAPSVEEWDALSPADRAAVVAALPGEVTYDEMAMPEGDLHFKAKIRGFYAGTALLLESEGLIGRLQEMYDEAQQRIEEEARRREQAEQLAEEERRRREQAEQEVSRLREELERLKR